jgi:MSHA biogenesis protein MshL
VLSAPLQRREATCWALGAICLALIVSGCAALKNFPGKEGPRADATEPPAALRPSRGEPPPPAVTAQAPPAVPPSAPAEQIRPPPQVAAAPPAQPREAPPAQLPVPPQVTVNPPVPPLPRPAPALSPPGLMPSLPLTQVDDRFLAADLDNRTFALTFPHPVAIQDLLLQLVRGTSLSMIPDPGISGVFTGDLKNVTVRQALGLVLQPLGLDYTIDGRFIRVFKREPETRLFDINYVATQRTGTAGLDASGGGGAQVSSRTATDLFADLTTGIRGLLSERATFNLDRKAGLLQVSDFPERLDRIAVYLDAVHDRVHRQVQIDVRVVEVELKNAAAQTIDWSAVAQAGSPAGGGSASALTSIRVTDIARLLKALEGQGKVSTIAGTRILALNNETAVVRAASDVRTRPKSERSSEPPATDGLTVMVTPQIGSDGSVMLSLSPTLTLPMLDADGNRVGGSLGIADMLARLTDGETIVVSGFGRLLDERDARTGAARSSFFRRSTEVTRKRSEVLILLTPRVVHSTTN